MWLETLKMMKEQSGMTTKEISIKSGIPEPTLEKLFAGATKDPKLTTMQQLVHFLGYTLDDLDGNVHDGKSSPHYSGEALRIAKRFDELDQYGQNAVSGLVDVEHTRCTAQEARSARRSTEESREWTYEEIHAELDRQLAREKTATESA